MNRPEITADHPPPTLGCRNYRSKRVCHGMRPWPRCSQTGIILVQAFNQYQIDLLPSVQAQEIFSMMAMIFNQCQLGRRLPVRAQGKCLMMATVFNQCQLDLLPPVQAQEIFFMMTTIFNQCQVDRLLPVRVQGNFSMRATVLTSSWRAFLMDTQVQHFHPLRPLTRICLHLVTGHRRVHGRYRRHRQVSSLTFLGIAHHPFPLKS
ncbi:hypothetical protein C8F04DRAFT_1120322, partial [Mycena alexandri]